MPAFDVIISHAASNHTVSGVLVPWKMVPAVTLTRRLQPPQEYRPSRSGQATPLAQCGQIKPPGQRNQSR